MFYKFNGYYSTNQSELDWYEKDPNILLDYGYVEEQQEPLMHEFEKNIEFLRTSHANNRFHWHIDIIEKGRKFYFKRGRIADLDVTEYLI
ncbi:hypothetical protein BABA_10446 [Neobacillus bataviensis LMG 21833]|uniref:Uncharacterized protein n=1 Tax=Neobacillus bataviensis LMG 21833 TaxID=1117379 RepID=K6CDQ3_9BACI|nr:hypothetical protein BABA_10446 [Neobacillus bataviensis LMG 21833]